MSKKNSNLLFFVNKSLSFLSCDKIDFLEEFSDRCFFAFEGGKMFNCDDWQINWMLSEPVKETWSKSYG